MRLVMMTFLLISACAFGQSADNIKVGLFKQQIPTFYSTSDGIPANDIAAVALAPDGIVYAGTSAGLAQFQGGQWSTVEGSPGAIEFLDFADATRLMAISAGAVHEFNAGQWKSICPLPEGARATALTADKDIIAVGTDKGLFRVNDAGACEPDAQFNRRIRNGAVRAICITGENLAVATDKGVFESKGGRWRQVTPGDDTHGTILRDAAGIACDAQGTLWIASSRGVFKGTDPKWTTYTGSEGLPYNEFTSIAVGENGVMWFGTTKGAIRFDGKNWEYRQGKRWLPSDAVRGIAVNAATGDAWFATAEGVGLIAQKPMTLAQKAKYYEDEIDKYHRRTEYGYVADVGLRAPGDKSQVVQYDTDNDGLWTSMYGAGECFAYGATKDPKAKERAKAAFEALRFLQVVTQGGNPPALPGFIARTVVPASERNPNDGEYTAEKDLAKQEDDVFWKVLSPRWPMSADGKWYWKSDTSSDELDGHYFFYPLYYDLVADTDEEKERVREVVRAATDHLVQHDFALVDWDGKPTRWAVFGPKEINHDSRWFIERGLNSLSILSYLCTAAHVTGDEKYNEALEYLVKEHAYDANMIVPKMQNGIGSGNQSDDEMAFMSFYNLIKYCKNPRVRAMAALAFKQYWLLEKPEMNPFFTYAFAAVCKDVPLEGPLAEYGVHPEGQWLEESLETLVRFPLDRVSWGHENSHRIDLIRLGSHVFDGRGTRGYRVNGFVLPVDERYFNHWNTDPWQLDYREGGTSIGPGTVYLLPYYMGLYHGFIVEQ